jgi:LytR cell envelope-related transcriptional attenuator
MSQEQRRPRREPVSRGSSINSTMSIVVAAVAVLLGFLILRDIRGGSTTAPAVDGGETTTSVSDTIPVETTVAVTIPLTAFKIQVANASKVSGSAGQLTTELQGRGYIVQPAVNASEITPKQTATVVYYLPGSEGQAALVAAELGGVATAIMPAPIPTEGGKLGEASVLILLGTDVAGKPLASPVPTVPVVPVVTTVAPG